MLGKSTAVQKERKLGLYLTLSIKINIYLLYLTCIYTILSGMKYTLLTVITFKEID